MNESHEIIGQIASEKHAEGIKLTYSELRELLEEDYGIKYGSNRGLAKEISAAYDWWEENYPDQGIHHIIAETFTDKDGNYPYM